MNKIIGDNFLMIIAGAIVVAFLIKKILGIMTQSTSDPNGQKLMYTSEGRSGYVHYKRQTASFPMYWEFGGGDVVASISIPSIRKWVSETGIPLEKREEVLNFIGNQVVKDQTTNGKGSFKIEEDFLVIYS
jgi:hypothetical protein